MWHCSIAARTSTPRRGGCSPSASRSSSTIRTRPTPRPTSTFVLEVAARETGSAPGRASDARRHSVPLQAHGLQGRVRGGAAPPEAGVSIRYCRPSLASSRSGSSYNLHPPLLRAMGLNRKLELGPWFPTPVLRGPCDASNSSGGLPFDPFGYAHVRREEQRLVGWYRGLVETALETLHAPRSYPLKAVELATLPDAIRGYEEIKLRNIARARARAEQLGVRL